MAQLIKIGFKFLVLCGQIAEDLHFVLRMRHTFESLGYQSGFYLSQLFASTRGNISSPSPTTIPLKQNQIPTRSPPLFNWAPPRTMPSPNFHNPTHLGYPPGPSKDEPHMFLHPHTSEPQMENMMGSDHVQNDIKWPNGLSFFSALTGRSDDAKLLFNDGHGNKPDEWNPGLEMKNPNDFLSLDNTNSDHNVGKVDHNKYKRSFTLPARMATSSSSSSSLDHHRKHNPNGEYRNPEASMYSDVMETFLE